MSKKIEIIGQSLVITDTDVSKVLFDAPKADYYYKSDRLLKDGVIEFYSVDDNNRKKPANILLAEAVNTSDVAFTEATFASFSRVNLGFNTGGGSGVGTAVSTTYNNTDSNLSSSNVKDALDELDSSMQPSLITGAYDITTNTPILSNTDTNKTGTRYRSTTIGTRDFGAGDITLGVDDVLENDGSIWYKSVDNNQSGDYENIDNTNDRLRKYIIPQNFNFQSIPANYNNAIWEIRFVHDIGLNNITLPDNVTLEFNGGIITNYGTISGSYTKIKAGLTMIFDNTGSFSGDWSVVELYPQWFGAISDNSTDCGDSFQSMFDFIDDTNTLINVKIPSGLYYTSKTINLPSTNSQQEFLSIRGYGATISTDMPDVSIFKRMPIDQSDAMSMISNTIPVLRGIKFKGSGQAGQIGLQIGATYSMAVEDCSFNSLDRGLVSTFGLQSTFKNLRFGGILSQPLTIQSGFRNYLGVQVWSGAAISNSASNVSVVSGCRVYGSATQSASYTILGSDAVRVVDCISEGSGQLYDLFFDSNSSTTVKNFYIENFHAESPNAKVNFKVKTSTMFRVKGLRRSYPAAIFDISGSTTDLNVVIDNCMYWGNMPPVWFYHATGEGYGGNPANSGNSSGAFYTFTNCGNRALLDSTFWENTTRPFNGMLYGELGANAGGVTKTNGDYTFNADTTSRKFFLEGFHLLFKDDNVNWIGKRTSILGRPRGISVGTNGIEFNEGGYIRDCVNGYIDILSTDIGFITSGSTKSITLTSAGYPPLSGLTKSYVTSVNLDDSFLPSGIIVSNVETGTNSLTIRFANIAASDITIVTDIPSYFNSLEQN